MPIDTVDRVLVTGASGFIAKHIVRDLLAAGHQVRGSVRSDAKERALRAAMLRAGAPAERLEIVRLDLQEDAGWLEAAAGCSHVLHTASPFPGGQPRDKCALVPAARGGVLRVCAAAKAAGVRRVVLTSSVAAICYGHRGRDGAAFGEADFSQVDSPDISPYAVSKTLAEQAAWEAMAAGATELVTINPSLVLGPLLDADAGTSARLIAMMMNGRLPMLPNMRFGIVDVRDVASAHLRAMLAPDAAGRRFIVSAQTVPLQDLTTILSAAMPAYSARLRHWTLPDWTVRLAARVSRQAAMLAAEIGAPRALDTTPARTVLGMSFRSADEAVLSLADSLVRYGLVTPPR